MKIEYVHASDEKKEKTINTETQYVFDKNFAKCLGVTDDRTQEEYDKWLLQKLEEQKKKGIIKSYKIVA